MVFSILGVFILGILLLPRVLNVFSEDIAPIDDADLQLQAVSILEEDNAYFVLERLIDVTYEPQNVTPTIYDMIEGRAWSAQVAKEVITKNKDNYALFDQAARKRKYQNPALADPKKISLEVVARWLGVGRSMGRLSALRALYLAQENRGAEALDEVFNGLKVGQKVQESQNISLIEYLVASAIKQNSLGVVQRIVSAATLGSAELIKYSRDLEAYYGNKNGLISALKYEYNFSLLALDEVIKEAESESSTIGVNPDNMLNQSYYYKRNKTRLLFANSTRVHIQNVNKTYAEVVSSENSKVDTFPPTTIGNFIKAYITENYIGMLLSQTLIGGGSILYAKKCQEDVMVGATQAMIALKAYQLDNGNLPTTLDELVPKYLTAVPTDAFDGKPLRYSQEKKIIYSVGEDLKDSGGSTGDNWKTMEDPTFTLNF